MIVPLVVALAPSPQPLSPQGRGAGGEGWAQTGAQAPRSHAPAWERQAPTPERGSQFAQAPRSHAPAWERQAPTPERGSQYASARYVVPAPDSPHEHAPLRALATSDDKPAGVKIEVKPQGRMRYAQITFGSPGSLPITLAVDDVGPAVAHLYVDTERAGAISAACKVSGDKGAWRIVLDALAIQGKNKAFLPRTLLVKYQRFTRTLAVATCGHIEGTVRLGDKKIRYRRVDGDANGLFADRDDQLWLDLDGDGQFAPRNQRFLWRAVLSIGGPEKGSDPLNSGGQTPFPTRYQVRGDAIGKYLALEPLVGEGILRVKLTNPKLADGLKETSISVVDQLGSVYPLDLHGDNRLPVGIYRFHALEATWQRSGSAWRFIFLNPMDGAQAATMDLRKDATVTGDPLAGLSVMLAAKKADDSVCIDSAIRTRGGLMLYRCARDGNWEQARARLSVRDGTGREIGRTETGFT
jgi:hypothetical protein